MNTYQSSLLASRHRGIKNNNNNNNNNDDDYTIAQWLEHRWLQARVPGSSPGGDSQFFLQTFPVCLFPSKPVKIIIIIIIGKQFPLRQKCDNTHKKDTLQAHYKHLESFCLHKYTLCPVVVSCCRTTCRAY